MPNQPLNINFTSNQPFIVVKNPTTCLYILGTAHVSKESAAEVAKLVETQAFDALAIEVCPSRLASLQDPDSLAKLDLFEVVKQGKAGMVAANLALGSFQQRLAEQSDIRPGEEMLTAIHLAKEYNLPLFAIDRDLGITLKRVYKAVPWWQRANLLMGIFVSLFSKEKISSEDIEKLKQGDILEATFAEFAAESKYLYTALITERDEYMALRLAEELTRQDITKILVVVGAGHLQGLAKFLQTQEGLNFSSITPGEAEKEALALIKPEASQAATDLVADAEVADADADIKHADVEVEKMIHLYLTEDADVNQTLANQAATKAALVEAEINPKQQALTLVNRLEAIKARLAQLSELPPPNKLMQALPWLVVGAILLGFILVFQQDAQLGWGLVLDWILINGGLAALGVLAAGGHPLTLIAAFCAAPLTSLNPTIGVGFVAAAVEIYLRKPKVADFSRLKQDTAKVSGWWHNRVARTLLVFIFSTLGSALGTYIAGFKIFQQAF